MLSLRFSYGLIMFFLYGHHMVLDGLTMVSVWFRHGFLMFSL